MVNTSVRLLAALAVATSVAGTATAGPCETTKQGTYLSNVCWLVEEFSENTPDFLQPKIASADEKSCTVTLTKPYLGTAGGMVHFDRGDPKSLKVVPTGTKWLCWHLSGEGVSEGPLTELPVNLALMAATMARNSGQRREDRVTVCGSIQTMDLVRIVRAFRNLYGRYCRGRKSEF